MASGAAAFLLCGLCGIIRAVLGGGSECLHFVCFLSSDAAEVAVCLATLSLRSSPPSLCLHAAVWTKHADLCQRRREQPGFRQGLELGWIWFSPWLVQDLSQFSCGIILVSKCFSSVLVPL